MAERGEAGIGRMGVDRLGTPVHRQAFVTRDLDLAAQAVEGEALDQIVRNIRLAIEQDRRAMLARAAARSAARHRRAVPR